MGKQGVHKTLISIHYWAQTQETDFKMKILLLLVSLTACAATPQDLSGKMFTFPQETSTARVRLTPAITTYASVTICHRSFTDLKRDHGLFSLATPSSSNGILIFWDEANKEMEAHIADRKTEYRGLDYKPNMWHSICTTWDTSNKLLQIWFDGRPTIKKFASTPPLVGAPVIVLGQEQDNHGGGFDLKQSFVGMMTDVHMWDHVLSSCEIHKYMDELNFTPGNVLNWSSMEYEIIDRVLTEDKLMTCHQA